MFFSLRKTIQISLQSLLSNKWRSFLTILGIVIGVAAVNIIMSVGGGVQSLILSQIEELGSGLVGVIPGHSDGDGPPASMMGITITTLKYEDALALYNKKNVPNVESVVAYSRGVGTAIWQSHSYDTNLSGVSHSYMDVEGGSLALGRFFTEDEERNLSKVIVLGYTVKEELFGESVAIGQTVRVKKVNFRVIGVMEERGTVAFQNYDDQIFIPIKSMQKLILGTDHLGMIRLKVDSENNIEMAIADMEATLRSQHGIKNQDGGDDDFTVRSASQALDVVTSITDALRYFLGAMAALSLLVGGVGIMNIMLINVSERTSEIGLRKALGATYSNILWQFLVEAVVVTVFGGLLGVFFGWLISFLISVIAHLLNYTWDFVLPLSGIFISVLVSFLIGLTFGIIPARDAARLDPIEALRYE